MNLPRSILLQWHVTERCDHTCRHCYQDGTVTDLPYEALLNILGQFRSFLASLRSQSPTGRIPAQITVSGGEPFLRADFYPLLECFHELRKEFSFAILTSGSLIDRISAERLKKLGTGFVQVSLEGTRETHDAIRGRGDFERVIAAIRHLKKAAVPVLISFTAHRGNYREFGQVAAIGKKLGVRRVWTDRFVPLGGAGSHQDMVLSPSETDEFLDIVAAAGGKRSLLRCTTEVATKRALQFRTGDGRPYRCTAGRELITVLADGTLTPCRRMPIPVGNLMSTDLTELYATSSLFSELRREDVPAGCGSCFYRHECRGGLRCLSHALTGSFDVADPGCSMVQY